MKLILTTLAALAIGAGSLKADDYELERRIKEIEERQAQQDRRFEELKQKQQEEDFRHATEEWSEYCRQRIGDKSLK
jgi:cell division protein FtsL